MIPILIPALVCLVLTLYMTILKLRYDMFPWLELFVYHYWNFFQTIPVTISFHCGSKTVSNYNKLKFSVVKIVNDWEDVDVINRVGKKYILIILISY